MRTGTSLLTGYASAVWCHNISCVGGNAAVTARSFVYNKFYLALSDFGQTTRGCTCIAALLSYFKFFCWSSFSFLYFLMSNGQP